jgi:hypothetical protein
MKVTPKATENTKVEDPKEIPPTEVKKVEASADKTEGEAVSDVEVETETPQETKSEETELKKETVKSTDPIESAPADSFMKSDEVALEEEKTVEAPVDIARDEELLSKFLANPSKVVEEISDSAVAKLRKSIQDENNAKSAWKTFYTENKDLEAHPELVQMVTNRLHSNWKKEGKVPSWEDGKKILAKEVRTLVSKIRASDSDVEAVDTESKAAVVSSSGNPAPRGVTKPAERKGFVDQIRQLQESKGKTLN